MVFEEAAAREVDPRWIGFVAEYAREHRPAAARHQRPFLDHARIVVARGAEGRARPRVQQDGADAADGDDDGMMPRHDVFPLGGNHPAGSDRGFD